MPTSDLPTPVPSPSTPSPSTGVSSEDRKELIRASAGSGKTFQLSGRYLARILRGVAPETILATTFTRKAAGEILGRVVLRLAEATRSDSAAEQLGREIGLPGLTVEQTRDGLVRLTSALHRLQISTLDSFFGQLAGAYSLELGLVPGWRVVNESDLASARAEAVRRVLAEGDGADIRSLLDLLFQGEANRAIHAQVSAQMASAHPLYRQADPGAWTILERRAELAEAEQQTQIVTILQAVYPNEGMRKAASADIDRFLAGDTDRFLSTGLAAKVADGSGIYNRKEIPESVTAAYQKLIFHVVNERFNRLVGQHEGTFGLLARYDHHLEETQQARQSFTFADLPRRLAAWDDLGSLASGGFRLDARLDHLLLDEFQDTAPDQWRVLRPFAKRITASPTGTFFCVGDTKQAIYGWRGGEAALFDALPHDLGKLTEQALARSYRSSPVIMDAVNQIFERLDRNDVLAGRPDVLAAWRTRFTPHTTARTDLPGYVTLETYPETPEDQKSGPFQSDVAATRIAALATAHPDRTIGVLVRGNQEMGELVFRLRQHHDLAVSEEGGNPLDDSAPVRLLLSLLTVLEQPGNKAARFHVATSPLSAGWNTPIAPSATTSQSGGPIRNAGSDRPTDRQTAGLARSRLTYTDWRSDAATEAFSRQARSEIEARGTGPFLAAWADVLRPHAGRRDRVRLDQFVNRAYRHDEMRDRSLRPLIEAARTEKAPDPTSDRITVMTIHKSKGLEFDIVVLPDLNFAWTGSNLPNYVIEQPDPAGPITGVCRYVNQTLQAQLPDRIRAMFDRAVDRTVNEQLCVLYVAITRARQALHLLIPPGGKGDVPSAHKAPGLLVAALTEDGRAPAGRTLAKLGNPSWDATESHPRTPVLDPADEGFDVHDDPRGESARYAPVRLAAVRGGRHRDRRPTVPSYDHTTGRSLIEAITLRRSSVAARRSQFVHSVLARIEWLGATLSSDHLARLADQTADEVLAQPGTPPPASEAEERAWRQAAETALARSGARELLTSRRYPALRQSIGGPTGFLNPLDAIGQTAVLRVRREHPYAVRLGGDVIRGLIDRLVLVIEGGAIRAADVIDFKTDYVQDAGAEMRRTVQIRHGEQLARDRQAVAASFGLPLSRVGCAVYLISHDVLIDVSTDDAPTSPSDQA